MIHPYIRSLYINDCYTYHDLSIDLGGIDSPMGFKHLVLTGKNGSGKTTILTSIANVLGRYREGRDQARYLEHYEKEAATRKGPVRLKALADFARLNAVIVAFDSSDRNYFQDTGEYILTFFKADRILNLKKVTTVTTDEEFVPHLNNGKVSDAFVSKFKQYLVNKKVYEAFDSMEGKSEQANQNWQFFQNFTNSLREVFGDTNLELEFERESFEFFIRLSDRRRLTFDQLSHGFSAFLTILMDLFMRNDLIQREKQNFSYDAPGYVIIDEPETHFHLEMQYQILPLISKLFPKLQLIVATHSPAIISSLKNAVIYDLSTQKQVEDWVLGSSYSELMITHFGLDNEFSPTADLILQHINNAVREKNADQLKTIIVENERFLTPSLRLEIESRIIDIESQIPQE